MSVRSSGSVRVLGSQLESRLGLGREWRVQCSPNANGWRGMLTVKGQGREPREFLEGGGQRFGAFIADLIAWSVCGGGGWDRGGTSGYTEVRMRLKIRFTFVWVQS